MALRDSQSGGQGPIKALIYAPKAPTREQMRRFWSFLSQKYGAGIELRFEEDRSIKGGFILKVGMDVYDWSLDGRLRQFKEEISQFPSEKDIPITTMIREHIEDFKLKVIPEEIGRIRSVSDGIAQIEGLSSAFYGEILVFENGMKGMVQDLREEYVGCILFGDDTSLSAGSRVFRTQKEAGIPVGEGFIGRIVDPLGEPIDGQGAIVHQGYRPIETPAPGIIDREAVNQPLETGLLMIDALFPIGRGQRELIIGDRQTGKTTIAIDTILNQKDKNVICIYVAIGQKNSSIAVLSEVLRQRGAMEYTCIVAASASDAATLQYIAPYAGCALGEYFMNKGQDVLIVYDDLSKHATAYRTMSLLLGRSPGREAYPGDVFYLHSRLLERSAHLSKEKGGGSMTALPIVETQAGDVSSYIPTNIISITDGQIFLESDLFFSGQRPAVNVGLSVSRVGGSAQTKAMKQSTGTMRLDLSQYREMEIFTQFSSDLDNTTRQQLDYGKGLMELLKQPAHEPYAHHEKVILLIVGLSRMFLEVPVKRIREASMAFLSHMHKENGELCYEIDRSGIVTGEQKERILTEAKEFLAAYREEKKQAPVKGMAVNAAGALMKMTTEE